jgi:4-alpha-glucanotransferase
MENSVYLCLVLHNHQPIGNFENVIEQAYQDSYLPFLEVFEPFEHLRIALHTSGPLMEWLEDNHPEYLERLRVLIAAGRIEIVGGPFYEPILTMLPSRDRIGQIIKYRNWLQQKLSTDVVGMWMPERVWESQLTRDIAKTGMQYTILDDFHFRAAGWNTEELTSYFVTEDDGHILRVFPGSERLRYLIPFAPPEQTIEYARQVANEHPGAVLVFGDDGEKFGTWPETKAHVYERGWLRNFFEQLTQNRSWLRTATPREIIATQPPAGSIFLPDCSYREMTEWSLPVARHLAYEDVVHLLQDHSQWNVIQRFIRGGNWRNFRVKYPEANEMYCRMLEVSKRLEHARLMGADSELLEQAENHLYRGQCNCPYWHGAFGGIYLPHLRNANYRELIVADNLLEQAAGREEEWVEATTDDFNNDLFAEVRLANQSLIAYFAPNQGGMLYELDVRSINHNLLGTLRRREESYHTKVRAGATNQSESTASIHDRVIFKQHGLDQRLQYDNHPRKSLIEHFWPNDATQAEVFNGTVHQLGDFLAAPFDAKLRRGHGKVQIQQQRNGVIDGLPIQLTKAVTLESGSDSMRVVYLITGLPPGRPLHFASEWNFAGMPAGADDRFFYDQHQNRYGQLASQLDIRETHFLGLIDQWQGLDVQLKISRPTNIWTFPVETVSQSEGGFELVHQSVCVLPHWLIQGDVGGNWSVEIELSVRNSHEPVLNQTRSEQFAFA